MKKILIATPAYGGMLTVQYTQSLVRTMLSLSDGRYEFHLHMQENESLISRGRNTAAIYALKHGFDKLLFIDADMIFTPEKVEMLLKSERDIVGGTYPLKSYPITLNFNPLTDERELFGKYRQQDNYIQWVRKFADERGEAEVAHLPTGFMLIDCRVLATLSYKVPWYTTYAPDRFTHEQAFDFFPVRVVEHEYESEDWAFCSIARENGFKVFLQTKAVCGHIGVMKYGLGQHVITGQEPLIGADGKVKLD